MMSRTKASKASKRGTRASRLKGSKNKGISRTGSKAKQSKAKGPGGQVSRRGSKAKGAGSGTAAVKKEPAAAQGSGSSSSSKLVLLGGVGVVAVIVVAIAVALSGGGNEDEGGGGGKARAAVGDPSDTGLAPGSRGGGGTAERTFHKKVSAGPTGNQGTKKPGPNQAGIQVGAATKTPDSAKVTIKPGLVKDASNEKFFSL